MLGAKALAPLTWDSPIGPKEKSAASIACMNLCCSLSMREPLLFSCSIALHAGSSVVFVYEASTVVFTFHCIACSKLCCICADIWLSCFDSVFHDNFVSSFSHWQHADCCNASWPTSTQSLAAGTTVYFHRRRSSTTWPASRSWTSSGPDDAWPRPVSTARHVHSRCHCSHFCCISACLQHPGYGNLLLSLLRYHKLK